MFHLEHLLLWMVLTMKNDSNVMLCQDWINRLNGRHFVAPLPDLQMNQNRPNLKTLLPFLSFFRGYFARNIDQKLLRSSSKRNISQRSALCCTSPKPHGFSYILYSYFVDIHPRNSQCTITPAAVCFALFMNTRRNEDGPWYLGLCQTTKRVVLRTASIIRYEAFDIKVFGH